MKKRKKKQAGQAILEFLIVICITLTLAFMLIQVSLGIAWGHYVHYATYMASRALFAAGTTRQGQEEAAKKVLEGMVKSSDGSGRDLLPFVAQARTADERDIQGAEPVAGAFIGIHPFAENSQNTRSYAWAQGVQYNFQVPLFLLPMAGWVTRSRSSVVQMGRGDAEAPSVTWRGKIPFTSDSWLGREVSVRECEDDMRELGSNGAGRSDGADFLYDNGC